MEVPKVDPEKIHLQGIKVLKAHFEVEEELMDKATGLSHFNVDLEGSPAYGFEEKVVRFRLQIAIQGFNKEKKKIGVRGKYCIDSIFYVENLEDFMSTDENKEILGVDKTFAATIAGISYSTSRGIVLDRTQGTEFKGVILPVINPYDLLKKN